MPRQYITTAIDYPNAAPHMGHVLEKVLADIMARWFRLRGDSVRFQVGTDEHGTKIQQTAKAQGLTPRELVEKNVPLFHDLYDQLGISYGNDEDPSDNCFIRTTDKERHWPTVIELWKRINAAKGFERRTYTGLYCSGCERFLTKKDLVDGKCPDHQKEPQEVKEENYFFLLKQKQDELKTLLTKNGGYEIVPSFRAHETTSLIEQGLEDVSFSRPRSSLEWGIPVPEDETQTMYVWCDALTNYASGIGLLTEHAREEWWSPNATVTHVIGKDIARFHALIWPAMLLYGGVPTPNRLLIHGFLTSEGQKMSKSIGNVVAPDEAIKFAGIDALRFYLTFEIPVGNDGDFSWKRFQEIYDSKLRNQLGNLLNRTLVLLAKDGGTLAKEFASPMKLQEFVLLQWKSYDAAFEKFELHAGLAAVLDVVDQCNVRINEHEIWKKEGEERTACLSELAETLRHVALMLLPFIPETAVKMAEQLNLPYANEMEKRDFRITDDMKRWGGGEKERAWKSVSKPSILFPPLSK